MILCTTETICFWLNWLSRRLWGRQAGTLKGKQTSEEHRGGRFLIGAMVLSDVITACGSQSEMVTMRPRCLGTREDMKVMSVTLGRLTGDTPCVSSF